MMLRPSAELPWWLLMLMALGDLGVLVFLLMLWADTRQVLRLLSYLAGRQLQADRPNRAQRRGRSAP